MLKFLITFLLAGIISFPLSAQEKDFVIADSSDFDYEVNEYDSAVDINTDTNFYTRNITIPADTIRKLKEDKDFAYMKKLESQLKESQDISKKPAADGSFFTRLFSGPVIPVVLWILAAFFVLFILFKLFNNQGIFKRRAAGNIEISEEVEKVYTKSDYSRLVQQSVLLGDYRIAVKYLFLYTLQELSEKELIMYASDKTNFQYVQEIQKELKNDFSRLVLNYEYVWYGHLILSRERFETIEKQFTAFHHQTVNY